MVQLTDLSFSLSSARCSSVRIKLFRKLVDIFGKFGKDEV